MIKEEKYIEYYFDSRKYDKLQVIENMKKEQLGFEKKESEIIVTLNEYGIYIARLKFLNNRLSFINNKSITKKDRKKECKYILEDRKTYDKNNKIYGKYKETKTYQPIWYVFSKNL